MPIHRPGQTVRETPTHVLRLPLCLEPWQAAEIDKTFEASRLLYKQPCPQIQTTIQAVPTHPAVQNLHHGLDGQEVFQEGKIQGAGHPQADPGGIWLHPSGV